MPENFKSRLMRRGFGLIPCYLGTGARVTYIADDYKEIRISLPLSLRTRNYVGTIFGGSMYGAVDPIYMIMLMKTLGPKYLVWDKSATIRFRKPGRSKLTARFVLDDGELNRIREALKTERSVDRTYLVELVDGAGVVHAEIDKTIYIKLK
jgi:hypothetical protein